MLYKMFNYSECNDILKKCVNSEDFTYINHILKPFEGRAGFLGDYCQLKIEIEQGGEKKVLVFFVKLMPSSEMSLEFVQQGSAFEKENFFLVTLYNEIRSFGLDMITEAMPECYYARLNDVIVLEDLKIKNFENVDVRTRYSVDMVNIVMKKLAKFHSALILYEEMCSKNGRKPVTYLKENKKYLKEVMILSSKEKTAAQKWFSAGVKAVYDCLIDLFPEVPKEITIEEFKSRAKEAFEISYEKVKPSSKFRNILCHGDLWSANILFRKENAKFVDCKFVDFQLTRYCPPAHDILLSIYMTADKNTIKQHMGEFLDTYYNEFAYNISKHGFDINDILPQEKFLKSCEYMKSQSVCQICVYSQLNWLNPNVITEIFADEKRSEEALILNRGNLLKTMIPKDDIYKGRLKEVIEILYEGCLNKDYLK